MGDRRIDMHLLSYDAAALPTAAEWSALAERAGEPNAFHEGWFLGPALRYLGDKSQIWIAEARENGQLAGILPLSICASYGRVPATHIGNWAHYQCFMGSPLVIAGAESSFWAGLLTALDGCDWARGFLSISGLLENGPVHRGLLAAAHALDRPAPTVHRYDRAALASELDVDAYLEAQVRGKKRKELRRLARRLNDEGSAAFSVLCEEKQIAVWTQDFLKLEAEGWKGTRGAAMANDSATTAFFREIVSGAFAAGKLDFQRLDLDDRPIAMLVNFRTPPGSWSFKIAYDEALARYSPGVMIELENLGRVLADPDVSWMDSCAVENHPMIDRLWGERRSIVQVSVPLKGVRRRMIYAACRAAETGSARMRRMLGKDSW